MTAPFNPDTHDPGIRSLLNAICLQAMTDYFIFYRMGAIKELKPTGYFKARSIRKNGEKQSGPLIYQSMTPHDIPELLDFLDSGFTKIMKIMGHHAPPCVIKNRILDMEKSGKWIELFGKGIPNHSYRRDYGSSPRWKRSPCSPAGVKRPP